MKNILNGKSQILNDISFCQIKQLTKYNLSLLKLLSTFNTKFYIVIISGQNRGSILLQNTQLDISNGQIYIFSKYNFIKNKVNIINAEDSIIITITEDYLYKDEFFFRSVKYQEINKNSEFFSFNTLPNSSQWLYIRLLIYKIKYINSFPKNYHPLALKTNLEALIYCIYEFANKECFTINKTLNISTEKFIDFIKLVNQINSINYSLDYYSTKLNISSSKLSSICIENVNETPHKVIRKVICNHAKELLLNSNKSIKEIGYELGFSIPTNFNKFFLQLEGTTPRKFRISKTTI